jgi:GTP-binding protein HflX
VASFHATLEEALSSDLLLHVVDASHPAAASQMRAVDTVLAELSPHARADIVVFNKIDRLEDPIGLQVLLPDPAQEVVFVSAQSGEGLDLLDEKVRRRLDQRSVLVDLQVPLTDGRLLALARRAGVVEQEELLDASGLRLRLRIPEVALGNLARAAGGRLTYSVLEQPRQAHGPSDPSLPPDGAR